MIEKIKALCVKHREILVYLIVGGLTTIVSWGCKFLWGLDLLRRRPHPTALQNTILSVVENASGIAFAYPTNRKWVFQSKNPNILAEAGSFVGSRLLTMLLGWLLNLLLHQRPGRPHDNLHRRCLRLRGGGQLCHLQAPGLPEELILKA